MSKSNHTTARPKHPRRFEANFRKTRKRLELTGCQKTSANATCKA